jgi:hypothetical protein
VSDTTQATGRAAPRAFTAILTEIRNGSLANELTEKLASVAANVELHRKKGEITLTLKLTPSGDGVTISDTVKATIPDYDRPDSFFYVGGEGALARSPFNQDPLPLGGDL